MQPEDVTLNNVIRSYKKNAKKRNLTWALSDAVAKKLLRSNCYYCNVPPCLYSNPYLTERGEVTTHGKRIRKNTILHKYTIYVNGIDRIDSSLDYTEDNVVAACQICNRAKSNISMASFLLWLSNLVSYRGSND